MMKDRHIASAFDRDLEGIQAQIMKMGGLVEEAILGAATSLETRDEELARKIRAGDKAIDALEESLNEEAARVSQKTAFFHLGNLVEFGETGQIFTNPRDPRTESYITGRIG